MLEKRQPAVAGAFYENDPEELKRSIEALFLGPMGPGRLPKRPGRAAQGHTPRSRSVAALVCPHAGYRFSGYAAAWAYLHLAEDGLPNTAVIIGPNHRGVGAPAALAARGTWLTPLGEVAVDEQVASLLLEGSNYLAADDSAHLLEHSLEVQIPFLQYISGGADVKIAPIAISALTSDGARSLTRDLGRAIASALSERNGVVIASTDFTHYEPRFVAEKQDRLAVEAIQSMDPCRLLDVVERNGITMCGAVPTAVAMAAAAELGAEHAELLSYYTSGDILGDPSQVVGYASLKIVRRTADMQDREGA